MQTTHRRRFSVLSLGCVLAFVLLLAAEAVYCYARPKTGLDTLFYVSLLHDGSQEAFRTAVATCDAELSVTFNGCDSMQEVHPEVAAYSAADYAAMLRFYTVKPGYLWYAALLDRLAGADAFRALRLASVSSFVAIGLLLAVWLRRHLSTPAACLVALLITATPQVINLGKWLLPDGVSLALMLAVIYLVLYRVRSAWLQLLLLGLLPLARPDNLVFCALWAGVLLWRGTVTGRERWVKLAALAAGCVAYNIILGRITHALPYRVFFVRSFQHWTPPATFPSLHVTLRDYAYVIAVDGTLSVVRYLAFALLFAVFALAHRGLWRPMRDLLLAALFATCARLLLFPGPEERYYVWLLVIAAVAAVVAMSELLPEGSWFGRATAQ